MKFLPTILLLLPLLTACNSELDFGGDTPGTKNAAIGFSNNMKITRADATLADIQNDQRRHPKHNNTRTHPRNLQHEFQFESLRYHKR